MTLQSAVDLLVPLSHHQFSVEGTGPVVGGGADGDSGDDFAGQRNALCGAASVRRLLMLTGLHTGTVPVRWEVHDGAPGLPGDDWADVVEASFLVTRRRVVVAGLMSDGGATLPLEPACYRVRYATQGYLAGFDLDTPEAGGIPPDRYLLQLWPAPPALDEVVRDGTGAATRRAPDRVGSVPLGTWRQVLAVDIAARKAHLDERARHLTDHIAVAEVRTAPSPAPGPTPGPGAFVTSVVANEFYPRPPGTPR